MNRPADGRRAAVERERRGHEPAPLSELEPEKLPRHVAVIMDGNGRWARLRGLPRAEGHRRGERAVHDVVECCGRLGIGHLTLYTFSVENWRRPDEEVTALMRLIETVASRRIGELHRKGVRLTVLGRLDELPGTLRQELLRDIAMTRDNSGLHLRLALNYGGRAEIVQAVRHLAAEAARGALRPEEITEESLARAMYDPEMPDPDLIIRTGGAQRLSNFLLWQSAYSELWITPTLWPDFGAAELIQALRSFQERERRFGTAPDS